MARETNIMATLQQMPSSIEVAILTRSIRPEGGELSKEAAKAMLHIGLGREDLDRLHLLIAKNQDDALTPAEKADLDSYIRVSSFFDLMHAKARSLRKRARGNI